MKKAINPRNQEHKELYHFLVRTFQAGDVSGYGEVGPAEFDEMIECAAAAPRRFGLAPKTEDMFKSKGVRFRYHMYLPKGFTTFSPLSEISIILLQERFVQRVKEFSQVSYLRLSSQKRFGNNFIFVCR